MSQSQAFTPAGTEIGFASLAAPAVFTLLGEVISIEKTGQKRETDDVTNLDSDSGYRELIGTIKVGGEVNVVYNLVPGNAGQSAASALFESGDRVNWKITYPGTRGSLTFVGFISEYGNVKLPVDKKAQGGIKVTITGKITENFGS